MDVVLVARGLRVLLGLTLLAVGVWLARRRDTRPPSGAFAVFLLAFGTYTLTGAVDDLIIHARGARDALSQLMWRADGAAALVVEIASLNFVARLLWPRSWLARSRGASLMLVALAAGIALTVFLFPRAYGALVTDASGAPEWRWNFLWVLAVVPTFSIYAALLTWMWARTPDPATRRPILLVALGFLPTGASNGFLGLFAALAGDLPGSPHDAPVVMLARALQPFVAAGALLTVAVIAAIRLRDAKRRGEAGCLLAFLAFGALYAWIRPQPGMPPLFAEALTAAMVLALPAIVLYGLMRGHIAGLDAKVRVTVKASTVAFVFLGIFLVVAEVAGSFFETRYGWAFGGLAAGLAIVAIHPIQRAAERVANAAIPPERAAAPLAHEERRRMYLEQARVAWSDGGLSPDERRLLDAAREHMGLSLEEAAALEREVIG